MEASAKTTFGTPPAVGGSQTELSIKGGVEGSTNSARESMSKNVMNATEKHAQKASSKREVNVETSFERTEDMGEEIAITRTIENLNASRTLNFTFRQMNQEYHSLLHLIDLRLAFYNGFAGSMEEFELYELEDVVNKYFKDPITVYSELKSSFLDEYSNVIDYQGESQKFLEEYNPTPVESTRSPYLRVIPSREVNDEIIGRQKYVIREANAELNLREDVRYVDGIIISNKVFTMKTDGVIVEALLGQANALDTFMLDARKEKIREEKYENNLKKAQVQKLMTGIKIINALIADGRHDDAITAYKEIFGIEQGIKIFSEIFGPQHLEVNKSA
ncbi:hypothetical protein ES703_102694 [subsurface metagenome]